MHDEENTSVSTRDKALPCLNCDTTLLGGATHCHKCGQAIKDARMTTTALIATFFTNLFNLDGKIWMTLRHMWKPAYLTKEYVSGRRKRYFTPARFFAVTLILHFLLVTYSLSNADIDLNDTDTVADITKGELIAAYDTIATELIPAADSVQLDTLRSALFGDARPVNEDTMFTNISLYTDVSTYGILTKDAYSMTANELFEKYEVTNWYEKLYIRQTIKINKNKETTLNYMIGNLSWVVILVVFFTAILMKILYIRGGYYYVEHAVLMMLLHSKVFFVVNIFLLLDLLVLDLHEEKMTKALVIIYSLSIVFLFITMKVYYQQGWFKTILKMWLIGLFYVIALFFFMIIVSIIGAALF